MNNKGFAFYENYWTMIQSLEPAQQKEVLYAIVQYGITGKMVDANQMPLGYAMTQGIKQSIDNSVHRWENNAVKATEKQDAIISRDIEIENLIRQGLTSDDIGKELGVSGSTIRRSSAWKRRKEILCKDKEAFVHDAQNFAQNVNEGVSVQDSQNVQNMNNLCAQSGTSFDF